MIGACIGVTHMLGLTNKPVGDATCMRASWPFAKSIAYDEDVGAEAAMMQWFYQMGISK